MINKKRQRGFTLIELTAVVIIITILVSMAMPKFFKIVEKSRQAEAVDILARMYRGFKKMQIDGNSTLTVICPTCWTDLDFEKDPNQDARHFDFYYHGGNSTGYALRNNDPTKWLWINLTTGNITKSAPYF